MKFGTSYTSYMMSEKPLGTYCGFACAIGEVYHGLFVSLFVYYFVCGDRIAVLGQ